MPRFCDSIDTIAMAYLDGELAQEELRDFDLHLLECRDCRTQVDAERDALEAMRRALAAPAAPDLVRARLQAALDAEDIEVTGTTRKARIRAFALPTAAFAVAAAALLTFFVARPPVDGDDPVASEAVRQHMRQPPLEVQGAGTTPWVHEHFAPSLDLPRFADSRISLVGARLSHMNSRDALQLFYQVTTPSGARFDVSTMIFDGSGVSLRGADRITVGGRVLWVDDRLGHSVVMFKNDDGMAYVFTGDLPVAQLADLVVKSSLVVRVNEAARGR